MQKISSGVTGAQGISDFVVKLITKVIIPILALLGIVFAIIGFFKIMATSDEEELKKGWNFILWWIIGTIIMVSAAWIVIQLVGEDGSGWIIGSIIADGDKPSGAKIISDLYSKIFYPFIRLVLNIIIWVMFLFAVSQWFKYLFSGDDEAQKQAVAILTYTVVWILIIILAKTLVELTYGKYAAITSGDALQVKPWWSVDLGKIGDWVFEKPEPTLLYTIINRVLALWTFFVTVIIIYIGYLILVNPTDEEQQTKLKNAITRGLAGILVIGAAYLLANFVIIN